MIQIQLVRNNGFLWYSDHNIHVKGYVFDKDEKYLQGNSLIQYFKNITDEKAFAEILKFSNGLFDVIIETGNGILAAVDIIRAFPLFYSLSPQGLIISDEPDIIINTFSEHSFNKLNVAEFLSAGYVTGNETLVEGIHQLLAGKYLYFDGNSLKNRYYFNYSITTPFPENYEGLKIVGKNVIERTFKRLIDSLNGRTAIVPLSGGFDSRLIVAMLKFYKYENVCCFTYGRKNNSEIVLSKQVADALGYRWIYIEYNHELIDGFIDDNVFMEYYKYSANYTSMFFMQEYFAVKYLKDNNIIPPDSIFIPGHSGDFLGGSQLTKFNIRENFTFNKIPDKILQTKYGLVSLNTKFDKLFKIKISKEIESLVDTNLRYLPYSVFEDWDCKEKLSKFNANSVSIYSFFGYEFRLPFWDFEITEFFKQVPYKFKWEKLLYDQVVKEYFTKYNINFRKELQSSIFVIKKQLLKNKLKSCLPSGLKYFLMNKFDNYYYYEITGIMKKQMINDNKKYYRKFAIGNGNIVQWYIYKLRKDERFSSLS